MLPAFSKGKEFSSNDEMTWFGIAVAFLVESRVGIPALG